MLRFPFARKKDELKELKEKWGVLKPADTQLRSKNVELATLIGHCMLLGLQQVMASGSTSPDAVYPAAYVEFSKYITYVGKDSTTDQDKGSQSHTLVRSLRMAGVPEWNMPQLRRKYHEQKKQLLRGVSPNDPLPVPEDEALRTIPGSDEEPFPPVKYGDLMWTVTLKTMLEVKEPIVLFTGQPPVHPWQLFRHIAHLWHDFRKDDAKPKPKDTKEQKEKKRKASVQARGGDPAQPRPDTGSNTGP